MRRLATTVMIMALFIITAQPADAQRQGPGQSGGGLESVDDGSWHPEPLDPADGTILGTFGPTRFAPDGATGRLIVNYLSTQGVARVNISIEGLEPGTYEVLMINHQRNAQDRELHSLTKDLVVDEQGEGQINVVWFSPFPFNAVNINPPDEHGTSLLSTIGYIGEQQQTPSNRGGNRGGGGR